MELKVGAHCTLGWSKANRLVHIMHHHHSNPVMFDLQATWCKKLLDGEKKVELRRYPIDPTYLGMPHLLPRQPGRLLAARHHCG